MLSHPRRQRAILLPLVAAVPPRCRSMTVHLVGEDVDAAPPPRPALRLWLLPVQTLPHLLLQRKQEEQEGRAIMQWGL